MSISFDEQTLDEAELSQVSGGRASLRTIDQVAATETNFLRAFDATTISFKRRNGGFTDPSPEGPLGPNGSHR